MMQKPVKPHNLRIISGKYRGRTLKSPQSALTHPMGAREKLALFNMVNVTAEYLLDAYAGSGALGIEAISRGAREVVFVENHRSVARILQQNLASLGLDAPVFVEKVAQFAQKPDFSAHFSVILADPPYDHIDTNELALLSNLLTNDGVLALSTPAELAEIALPNLRISSTHTYARARITIYRKL